MNKQNNRQIELDILRILAMFAVIITHVCGMKTHSLPVTDRNWQILTLIAAAMTWDVPAFVMISGRFFLDPDREITMKKLWGKSIFRLALAFIVWSTIYQAVYVISGDSLNWKGVLSQIVVGPNHFWYLYMLMCLYAIVPVLRAITPNKKLMEYYILITLAYQLIACYGIYLPLIGGTIQTVVNKTFFNFVLGYTGYFILGYYLYKYEIPDKFEVPLYILGTILIAFAAFGTTWISVIEGENFDRFSQYLLPNVMIESAAVYTLFVKRISKVKFSTKASKCILSISECSFGIYLIHLLINRFVASLGLSPIMASPFVMAPLLAAIVFGISFAIIWLIRKIPVIGKRIT